jgi:transmembrane sensor
MDQEKLTHLIKRYKSGTATPEEIAMLDRIWSDAEHETHFASDHTEAQLEDIQREMFFAIKSEIHKQDVRPRTLIMPRPLLYKVAATLLLLAAVVLWWQNSTNGLREIHTAFGEQVAVTLPDQSTVVLNGNSILRYAANWDENSAREVWIEGEGFFSVVHTRNHQKFVVHGVSELNVEVLGTKFNIKTRQSASEVMLAEGKVKLKLGGVDSTRSIFLKPGDLATVKDRKMSTQSVNKQHYTSWIENRLFFDRTPLRDLSKLLNETYGLKVTFSDPALETRELSGEISSASIDEILYAIGETLDLNVEKEGQLVTISPKSN